MKMLKENKIIVAIISIMLFTLIGCSNQEASSKTENTNEETSTSSNGETTNITLWHSMGGVNGETLDTLVNQFNQTQDDIEVEAIFQGDYGESFTKLKTSLRSDSLPTIMQSNFIRSGPMIDTKMVKPIQDFIDQENYDVSELDQNILSAYDMDGQLYSMPFNASTLLLYYNKDMFEENGLDPNSPPETYEELTEYAEAISDGNQFGASFGINAYFIEQLITVQGAELVNNGNGREGLADESLLNSDEAIATYEWWKDLVDNDLMLNLGTNTPDTHEAFLSKKTAMTLASTAGLANLLENSEGKFELGTGFIPYPADKEGEGGVSVGGGSLYIMDGQPEEEMLAGWEFIKYLMEPEQQAFWYINTGYFPVNNLAYDQTEVQETLDQFPQFETAINQLEAALKNNSGSNAGKGPVIGIYPDAREETQKAMEIMLNDKASPEQALNDAAATITKALERYNQTVQ
ncbi:ABC transporter substrate-binding protein [Gracilibacillus lacisalsi]|uniref:ABC transporter substrate-binding protein n=1 Tax=Gracilibacillus lacisalsi TaxID=393087 RepID=UPI000364DD27|nr:ABC transporter substrate-binding protein [Gracilibacillus lacisalsi]